MDAGNWIALASIGIALVALFVAGRRSRDDRHDNLTDEHIATLARLETKVGEHDRDIGNFGEDISRLQYRIDEDHVAVLHEKVKTLENNYAHYHHWKTVILEQRFNQMHVTISAPIEQRLARLESKAFNGTK